MKLLVAWSKGCICKQHELIDASGSYMCHCIDVLVREPMDVCVSDTFLWTHVVFPQMKGKTLDNVDNVGFHLERVPRVVLSMQGKCTSSKHSVRRSSHPEGALCIRFVQYNQTWVPIRGVYYTGSISILCASTTSGQPYRMNCSLRWRKFVPSL